MPSVRPLHDSSRHSLLRGTRWHLARPRSRALWTAATPPELDDLVRQPALRARLEDFLRLAASTVEVESLLLFDVPCVNLELSVSLPEIAEAPCAWRWAMRSARPRRDR